MHAKGTATTRRKRKRKLRIVNTVQKVHQKLDHLLVHRKLDHLHQRFRKKQLTIVNCPSGTQLIYRQSAPFLLRKKKCFLFLLFSVCYCWITQLLFSQGEDEDYSVFSFIFFFQDQ
uniref:Putative ovule protein n=1 Tax=Solanum chacoense TaxID=4108 RepID=A0A0V0GRP9_SOLCH